MSLGLSRARGTFSDLVTLLWLSKVGRLMLFVDLKMKSL